jgi:hypothetical protein
MSLGAQRAERFAWLLASQYAGVQSHQNQANHCRKKGGGERSFAAGSG